MLTVINKVVFEPRLREVLEKLPSVLLLGDLLSNVHTFFQSLHVTFPVQRLNQPFPPQPSIPPFAIQSEILHALSNAQFSISFSNPQYRTARSNPQSPTPSPILTHFNPQYLTPFPIISPTFLPQSSKISPILNLRLHHLSLQPTLHSPIFNIHSLSKPQSYTPLSNPHSPTSSPILKSAIVQLLLILNTPVPL